MNIQPHSSGFSAVLAFVTFLASGWTPAAAAESVKTWKAGTGMDAWHSGYSWDTDNVLDGGFPDSDDVAVFETAGNVTALFLSQTYDAAYCNTLDVRRGNVLLQGEGIPLMVTPQSFRPAKIEVDTATLSVEDTQVVVDTIRLAPKSWDSATLEVRGDAQLMGRQEYSLIDSWIAVGEEGLALLVVRTPSTPFDGAPGAAMIENFWTMTIGSPPGSQMTLDPGASTRVGWLIIASPGDSGGLLIHEDAVLQAPRAEFGGGGAATVTLRGTFDSRAQFFFDSQESSRWAVDPEASALITIDGGRFLEDAAIDVGRGLIYIENQGQMVGNDINLGQNGDGYVELYSSDQGQLIARGRLIIGKDGYTLLNAHSGSQIESAAGVIAENASSSADVILNGHGTKWLSSGETGEMNVGWHGEATLDVQAGATLENEWGFVARGSGVGTARIDGPGASWINHGNLTVGNGGGSNGSLTVANGASVECAYSQVGRFTGSSGFVDVRDPGSTWTVREELLVGGTGRGSLQISNGGRVEGIKRAIIATNAGSTGVAVVSGVNSIWHTNAALHVGSGSSGRLSVVDGGAVENNWAFLGVDSGVSGEATVSGPSSRWISNSSMAIGHHGSGSILIQNGAYVQGRDLLIGRYFDGTGEVTVEGPDSTLNYRGHLRVGGDGQGSLDVAGGGSVEGAIDVTVATNPGSTGVGTVSGVGATLRAGRSLYVGGSASAEGGVGTLTVTGAGRVEVTDTLKLWSSGRLELLDSGTITTRNFDVSIGRDFVFDSGTLSVTGGTYTPAAVGVGNGIEEIDGASPRLELHNSLLDFWDRHVIVGYHQNGTLAVHGTQSEGGALVQCGVLSIAEQVGSTGVVEMSGDSSLIETDVMIVAHGGTAELSVGSGSRVQNEFVTELGQAANGQGRVSVEGSLETANLGVGIEGKGWLSIAGRGSVSSGTALIAAKPGSEGNVAIATGGSWTVNGSCYVGGGPDGAPGGEAAIRVGDNSPGGPTTLSIAENLLIRSPAGVVTVESASLTAANILLSPGARVTMNGGSVQSGSIVLNGGSLALYSGTLTTPLVVGDLFTQGTILSPGEPIGTLQVNGSFGQGGRGGPFPPGSSTLEFGGRSGAVEHDSITVNGPASLGGGLHLRAIADFVPSPEDTFVLLRADTLEGTFWNAAPAMYLRIEGSPIECRVDYGPTTPYDANEVMLSSCRGTGDADGNGLTNLDDFAGMPACLAGPAEPADHECLPYDLDLSSSVDLRDFARVQINGIVTRR